MKVTLTFDLADDGDRYAYTAARQGPAMLSLLQTLTGRYGTFDDTTYSFKTLLKYTKLSDEQYDIVEKMEGAFYALLQQYNIDLDGEGDVM